jgi:C-terminal four TMM region of protein-O-mannosyltransferase/Dolichyl-phosphate-mannose-protein mannosyltransferase
VNAFNPWALIAGDTGSSLANSGLWVCDGPWTAFEACPYGVSSVAGIPPVLIGGALMLAVVLAASLVAAWRPDRITILLGLTVLAIAFYVVPTRVHERYAYPVFALAILLAAVAWRWRLAYVVLSITVFLNMYAALTNPFYNNPGISDWLGIGPTLRGEGGVTLIALANGAIFLWAFAQLRPSALARLTDELADENALAAEEEQEMEAGGQGAPAPEPAPSTFGVGAPAAAEAAEAGVGASAVSTVPAGSPPLAAAVVPMASWAPRPTIDDVGVMGWLRARFGETPVRPDRSATLRHEGGGRLDRLDLFLVVVLILGTLLLRTFRLAEPYQMHFDEVYHARTATEFLQAWRYGLSHDIYEWTHPHLAKYVMAGGLVAFGNDRVNATSELEAPVVAAAVEPRRIDETAPGGRAGERLHVATGTEIRTYDLVTRDLLSTIPAAGATALTIDETGNQLVIGYGDGRIATVGLELIDASGDAAADLAPVELMTVDHPVDHLLAMSDGTTLVAASSDRLTTIGLDGATILGSIDLPGIADLAPGGSGPALEAVVDADTDTAALAKSIADILGTDAADYEARMTGVAPGTTVVLGEAGDGQARTDLDAAIAAGTLTGVAVETEPRIAVATETGVEFLVAAGAARLSAVPLEGGAHGLAQVTGLDNPKVYATAGGATEPAYVEIVVGGDAAKDGPVLKGTHPLPAPGSWVTYDAASQMVHILGLAPDATSTAGPWTVYVIEPHGNAVYADARLSDGFTPTAWGSDFNPDYPASDRQQIMVFDGDGTMASIDAGSHAFAWRLPGVVAGALTAALLYLLTRILFRRRLVAALVGLFVIADGMFFVQSRIGMNDVYVGLFIVAAYTVFAAIWTGWWRGRTAFWLAMPLMGVLLGLALASKWVAAYAIGALLLLILVRSALGRVLAIIGLIGLTAVLGYMAISVPPAVAGGDPGFGNLTFLFIMVALTLLAVVVAVLHPIAWTDEEMRFAVIAPAALGALVFFGALATGRLSSTVALGSLSATPLLVALALAAGSLVVVGLFWLGGRIGFGPLAPPPEPDDPIRLLDPPGTPPEGWLRPGWALGIPVVWALVCLIALPVGVYILTYIPWAMVENHRLIGATTIFGVHIPDWPPGHTGQTLLDLTGQMYGYHNGLTAAHPASSPWWAWPMNLKPVWFYQEGLAAGTSAALYDAGSLVIWWLGIPALGFVSWMAYKRRSLALTLIAIGFAAQWIPWARIDRAAFQYHYYTALPFVVMALAYLAAELWHGASRHTWALARISAGVAIVAPAAMWLLHRPLCALVGVERVNPGSQACPAVIPDLVLTARTAGLAIVIGIGLLFLIRRFLAFETADERETGREALRAAYLSLFWTGLGVAAALLVVGLLPDTPILTLNNIPVEPIALIVAIPLGYLALQVMASRDARRFVVGFVVAVAAWFVILYPNISALPLPSAVVAAYQGILPTYLYAFQFPVSTVTRSTTTPLLTPMLAILLLALIATCLVVAYSAWAWRLTVADRLAGAGSGSSGAAEGLERSGGA